MAAAGGGCDGRVVPGLSIEEDGGPNLRGSTGDGSADLPTADKDAPVLADGGSGGSGGGMGVGGRGVGGMGAGGSGTGGMGVGGRGVGGMGTGGMGTGGMGTGGMGTGGMGTGGVCLPVTHQLLINPAFDLDTGSLNPGETGWTNPGVAIVYLANGVRASGRPDVAAQSSPNLAWFGGLNNEDDQLSQSVSIPAGATSLSFSFFYAVVTAENNAIPEADVFDASLLAGTQVISLAHLSENNATNTWTPVTVPIPATLAGQTVTVRLHGVNDAARITSFYIDTLAFQAIVCQ